MPPPLAIALEPLTSTNTSQPSDSPPRGSQSRHPHQRNPSLRAKELQASYRANGFKCFKNRVSTSTPQRCDISKDHLEGYFNVNSVLPSKDPLEWFPDLSAETPPSSVLTDAVSQYEVGHQLKRVPSSSSPGLDQLPYNFWKLWPGSGSFLVGVFNACLLNGQWKSSTTVRAYKKGDRSDPAKCMEANCSTKHHIQAVCIHARQSADNCIEGTLISPLQKSFMLYEGCFEHSFIMHSIFDDSKRRRKNMRVVFFDLRNAFGSVPHQRLFTVMSRLGIPPHFISLCSDFYNGSSTRYKCKEGLTEEIPQCVGVKQGCLLTGLDQLPREY